MKKTLLVIAALVSGGLLKAQYTDSASQTIRANGDSLLPKNKIHTGTRGNIFPTRSFIVPGILITYGFVSLKSDALRNINSYVKDDIWTKRSHRKVRIDDYLQFAPGAMVYVLNAVGI